MSPRSTLAVKPMPPEHTQVIEQLRRFAKLIALGVEYRNRKAQAVVWAYSLWREFPHDWNVYNITRVTLDAFILDYEESKR
ncbi:MAG: hypothetical protein HY868_16695 [Chloroflexi bacterium]|nr:hypothetical protein [Chloroflexota bacterium]